MFEQRKARKLYKKLIAMKPKEIYWWLKENDYKGVPGSGFNCPISNAFRNETGVENVSVGAVCLNVEGKTYRVFDTSIRDFIVDFDSDVIYKDLIK